MLNVVDDTIVLRWSAKKKRKKVSKVIANIICDSLYNNLLHIGKIVIRTSRKMTDVMNPC